VTSPAATKFPNLFSPITVGRMNLKHRLVSPPHGAGGGSIVGDDRLVKKYLASYVNKARGGAAWVGGGPIFVRNPVPPGFEPTGVGASTLSMFRSPNFVENEREFMRQLHELGAYGSVQFVLMGAMPLSASQTPGSFVTNQVPHAMSLDEIRALVEEYRYSAERCREAGVDALEVHSNHDDVVEYFMSPLTNQRTDQYGGSTENRLRFLREVLDAMRAGAGDHTTIGVRINMDQVVEGGYHVDEALRFIELLTADGIVDYFSVDVGSPWGVPSYIQPVQFAPGAWREMSAEVKKVTKVPVVYVGRVTTPELAEEIIAKGQADLVGINRAAIADPEFPNKAREGRVDEIRPCIGVNDCIHRSVVDGLGFGCAVNPESGKEDEGPLPATAAPKRVLVIGGGPAGLELAALAAERGHDVTLWERERSLGGQVRIAALAPMQESFQSFVDYQERRLRRLEVAVETGREATLDDIRAFKPDAVVLATGARARRPDVPGVDRPNVVEARDVLEGTASVGQRAVVIAQEDHMAPLSVADYLAERGHDVHIVYQSPQVAPQVGRYSLGGILVRLNRRGVQYTLMQRLRAINETTIRTADVYTGEEREIGDFDTVVLACGGIQEDALHEQLKGAVPEVHILGDAYAPRRITFATRQAYELAKLL
jgi:2,4-dienoyl-CoA reductase-like NADH-dependent reductase (Old Yellow Enzyme family)/thioredoxin reductase